MQTTGTGRHAKPRSSPASHQHSHTSSGARTGSRGYVVAAVAKDGLLVISVAAILKVTTLLVAGMRLAPEDSRIMDTLHAAQGWTVIIMVMVLAAKDVRCLLTDVGTDKDLDQQDF